MVLEGCIKGGTCLAGGPPHLLLPCFCPGWSRWGTSFSLGPARGTATPQGRGRRGEARTATEVGGGGGTVRGRQLVSGPLKQTRRKTTMLWEAQELEGQEGFSEEACVGRRYPKMDQTSTARGAEAQAGRPLNRLGQGDRVRWGPSQPRLPSTSCALEAMPLFLPAATSRKPRPCTLHPGFCK